MGRSNQLTSGGGVFHLTHRCHNRAFLLRFACDRDAYRAMLREQLQFGEITFTPRWWREGSAYGVAFAMWS
jgi:hypothetical protein